MAARSPEAFIGDAGHALRTPLTIVRGHLQLLEDDPSERADTLRLVMDELDRMARLIDDLVLLARAEHVDFLQRAPVALDELTADVSAKAERLGARQWRVDEVAAAEIDADRERLGIAMLNLASNAFEHTEPGAEIGIGSALRNGEAHLWVRDNGPGVAPGDESRIFEPFARGTDPRRRRSGGAGLGLAITRAIAAAHGGCVRLDNRPGEGATFTLVVPVAGGRR